MDLLINGLECTIHEPEGFEKTIVMNAGFDSHKDSGHRIQRANAFAENGFRVVRWTYRSSSTQKSTKNLTEDLTDLLSVINYFNCDVGMFGESWGGLLALQAGANSEKVKAVVARAPVVDLTYFSEHKPLRERPLIIHHFFEDLKNYNTYEDVLKRPVPTLILSGKRDETCPLKYHEKLFSVLPEPKKLVVLDEPHNWHEGSSYEKTTEEAIEWFKQFL